MDASVGIIGYGWVGKAMQRLFPHASIYDPMAWPYGTQRDVNESALAFVCVPTPCPGCGTLDTSIVEEVISWCECPLIVVRSTVNPGTCDRLGALYGKRICHQPEYLGETVQHPFADITARPFLVIGGEPRDRRQLIDLYTGVYNANTMIRQVSNFEAEICKLAENTAIAHKIAFAQELFDACQSAGADYYTVREVVFGDDPRQTLWHTFVYPDKRGMQSKCIPKDVYAWAAWAESLGASASITRALLERNEEWVAQSRSSSLPEMSSTSSAR